MYNIGSLREGAPAKRVGEPAQQNPLRFDMASVYRLCRRLLPSHFVCHLPLGGRLYARRKLTDKPQLDKKTPP